MLRFRALSWVARGQFASVREAFGTTRPSRIALPLLVALSGCSAIEERACEELDEPERYACGLSFRFICPAGDLDNAGTPGTWEVVGHVGIDDPRDGPVGLADVTLWADHGTGEAWTVCDYQAEVDAWPLVAE
jgi:hypothetical protein